MAVTVNGNAVTTVKRNSAGLAALQYNGSGVWPSVARDGTEIGINILSDDYKKQQLHITQTGPVSVDWGDGSSAETVTGGFAEHTYAATGAYTVTVTAEDGVFWKAGALADGEYVQCLRGVYGEDPEIPIVYVTSVSFDGAVTEILPHAFEGIYLTSVTFSETITRIGDYAFLEQINLSSLDIPAGVTEIGSYAFYRCTGLESVVIPASIITIGNYAFALSGITSVTVPASVFDGGSNMFYGCADLVSATVQGETVFNNMFHNCTALASIAMPNAEVIGDGAFLGCTSMPSCLEINALIIGISAFNGCTSMRKVWLNENVTHIYSAPFANCSSSLVLYAYCLEDQKPETWSENFNIYDTVNGLELTVVWDTEESPWRPSAAVAVEIVNWPETITVDSSRGGPETWTADIEMHDGTTYSGVRYTDVSDILSYCVVIAAFDDDTTADVSSMCEKSYDTDDENNTLIINVVYGENEDHAVCDIVGIDVCLSGDTLIALPDGGTRRFDEIAVGDTVLAADGGTATVMRISSGVFVKKYAEYTFEDGTVIKEMGPHRFYNVEQGFWQHLSDWNIGEHALDREGNEIALVGKKTVTKRGEQYGVWTSSQDYYANGLLSGDAAANLRLLADADPALIARMMASIKPADMASLNGWK